MSTYILWDIDGTLIRNTPSAGSLYIDAIEHVTGVRPTLPVENSSGMTEGQLLTELLAINGLDTARLGEVLYDLDVLSRDQFERGWDRDQCAGVEEALAAVTARGWTNALLTGNGPNRARYKLLAAGLDPELFDWDHSYFGHESPTRHHLTAGARAALAGNISIIVGDTPIDGLAADSAGFPFIAVATGMYSTAELAGTNAVTVIEDLESGLDALLTAVVAAGADDAAGTADDAPEAAETRGDAENAEAVSP
jgi:phosphoglycolate phosphatase